MKDLVEQLYKKNIIENEGYDYLFTTEVFLPINKSNLLITKRVCIPLNLVEEETLKLIKIGVNNIEEISKILGLNRKLLDITLADLYSKDLILIHANTCIITGKGLEAITKLNLNEKKQDVLKNIYLDAILGVVDKFDDSKLFDRVDGKDDNKLEASILPEKIEPYIHNFKAIAEIFEEEQVSNLFGKNNLAKEELIKIDNVEKPFVKFLKLPIHVYVSSNGEELDILSAEFKNNSIFNKYKDCILSQIREGKVLRNYFNHNSINIKYENIKLSEKTELNDELKKIYYTRNKESFDYSEIEEKIFSSRKLFDGEYIEIIKYLIKSNKSFELYVRELNKLAYDPLCQQDLLDISYIEKRDEQCKLYYCSSRKKQSEVFQIKKRCNILNIENKAHNYYICWKIGDYEICGIPTLKKIMSNKEINRVEYYLINNTKK